MYVCVYACVCLYLQEAGGVGGLECVCVGVGGLRIPRSGQEVKVMALTLLKAECLFTTYTSQSVNTEVENSHFFRQTPFCRHKN